MADQLAEWLKEYKVQTEKLRQQQEAEYQQEYQQFQETLNALLLKVGAVIKREASAGGGERYSGSSAVAGDPPLEIGVIKRLLGKLKALIPQRWWSGPLRDILDKILENLSPQNTEELQRLLLYVETVYKPALETLHKHWHHEMELEAYERSARTLLRKLLQQDIREL